MTLSLALLFIGAQMATEVRVKDLSNEFSRRAKSAAQFVVEHPYLEVPRAARGVLSLFSDHPVLRGEEVSIPDSVMPSAEEVKGQQDHLNALLRELENVKRQSPTVAFGYVPKDTVSIGLLTSPFIHKDRWALGLSLLFLLLAGPWLEMRWPRWLAGICFFVASAVACLAHKALIPDGSAPMIGASGAIAGVVGALMAWSVREGVFVPRLTDLRTLNIPPLFLGPFWLGAQVWSGFPQVVSGAKLTLVFGATAAGFLCGAAFALVAGLLGVKARPSRRRGDIAKVAQRPELAEAASLIEDEQPKEAFAILEPLVEADRRDVEALRILVQAAQAAKDRSREASFYILLVDALLATQPSSAVAVYDEMHERNLEGHLPPALRLRIARHLEKTNYLEGAAQEYHKLSKGAADSVAFQATLALANLRLRQRSKKEAIALFQAAKKSAFPHLDFEASIDYGLKQATALPD